MNNSTAASYRNYDPTHSDHSDLDHRGNTETRGLCSLKDEDSQSMLKEPLIGKSEGKV